MLRFIKEFIQNLSKSQSILMGRWSLNRTEHKKFKVVDLSNIDHCGTCHYISKKK